MQRMGVHQRLGMRMEYLIHARAPPARRWWRLRPRRSGRWPCSASWARTGARWQVGGDLPRLAQAEPMGRLGAPLGTKPRSPASLCAGDAQSTGASAGVWPVSTVIWIITIVMWCTNGGRRARRGRAKTGVAPWPGARCIVASLTGTRCCSSPCEGSLAAPVADARLVRCTDMPSSAASPAAALVTPPGARAQDGSDCDAGAELLRRIRRRHRPGLRQVRGPPRACACRRCPRCCDPGCNVRRRRRSRQLGCWSAHVTLPAMLQPARLGPASTATES